jgi:nucleoside-diphosphate-sugar epimerase
MPITEDAPLRTARQVYPPEVIEKMKSIFTWLGPGYDKIAVEQAVTGCVGNTVVRLPMVYGPGDPLHQLHGVLKRIKRGACDCSGSDSRARGGANLSRL